jgi:hypothetical protein
MIRVINANFRNDSNGQIGAPALQQREEREKGRGRGIIGEGGREGERERERERALSSAARRIERARVKMKGSLLELIGWVGTPRRSGR